MPKNSNIILDKLKYFILFFLILCIKQYFRFIHPGFWGEDGYIFLKRSLEDSYNSIFMTYAGYFQVLPQILSYISSLISLKYYPYLTLFICTAIFSYTLSLFTKQELTWITQSRFLGFIIALFIFFIPGQNEFLGNFSNIHSVLFLCCVLTLMYDLNTEYKFRHFLLFIFSGLSAGEICALLPLILTRMFLLKNKTKRNLYNHLTLLGIVLFSTLLNSYAYITNTYSIWTQGESGLQAKMEFVKNYFPNRFFYSFFNRMFLIPIFGDQITFYINQRWQSVLYIGFGFMILFFYFIYKTWNKKLYCIIFSSIFSYIILILMTCIVRKGTWNTAWFGLVNNFELFQTRYFFILLPISILSVYSILFSYLNKVINKKFAYLFIILLLINYIFQNKYNFFVPPYTYASSFKSWQKTADDIIDTREKNIKGQIIVTHGNSEFKIELNK
ncbi:hypothetical protein [Fluviispira multicolorata]|uniref:Glycosyltransferase RgtA/B/C/D-like domain-containing protein n=1 Tax=Fluviispira multicolorata TaxID=2654512 RepID=A0A833N395_9BACT|nr:hypothetical protein [Fluviispira multicolorata]KAB8033623.1 hypothetical protein GCL57_02640 [Fluviispira multicolorata]